ncbi:MAG: (d)CMP kinase [bacterium]
MSGDRKFSIAIDGPAGAGKSTVAKLLALRYGLQYVDTGAMYRGVALLALRGGIGLNHEERLAGLARDAVFEFRAEKNGDGMLNRVFLNGEEVTQGIRTEAVSRYASPVSAVSGVRRELVAKQQRMGARGGVVMEGRDIGTVVLPDAEVKIFLTASEEERARRRHLELLEKGDEQPLEEIRRAIHERDERDSTRADSPLVAAEDAIGVPTDGVTIEQVVDAISEIAEKKVPEAKRTRGDKDEV